MDRATIASGTDVPTLRDLMTTRLITFTPETTLRQAFGVLAARHIGGAPVVVGSTVVGVVSATDLLEFAAATPGVPASREDLLGWEDWQDWEEFGDGEEWEDRGEGVSPWFMGMWEDAGGEVFERFRQANGPEWDVLEEHTVEEVMSRNLRSLPPHALVREAAERMLGWGVHRVLVMEDGRLLGVVTTTDIMRAVAERNLLPA